jgi:hypothetical protein
MRKVRGQSSTQYFLRGGKPLHKKLAQISKSGLMTLNSDLRHKCLSTNHLLETPRGKIHAICFLELSYQFLETNKKCSFGFSYAALHENYCLIVINSLLVSTQESQHSPRTRFTAGPAPRSIPKLKTSATIAGHPWIDPREHLGSPFRLPI